jgi:hypothetical protein
MIRIDQLPEILSGSTTQSALETLYGNDPAQLAMQRQRWLHLADLFSQTWPGQRQVGLSAHPAGPKSAATTRTTSMAGSCARPSIWTSLPSPPRIRDRSSA